MRSSARRAAGSTQSRRGIGYSQASDRRALAGQVQYVVDFDGPALDALPPGAAVRAVVTADANGRVLEAAAYPQSRRQRLAHDAARAAHRPGAPVELRAFLQHDNHILSETWTNILLPE